MYWECNGIVLGVYWVCTGPPMNASELLINDALSVHGKSRVSTNRILLLVNYRYITEIVLGTSGNDPGMY